MLAGLDDSLNQNDCVYSIVFNLTDIWPHFISVNEQEISQNERANDDG